jgi:hypothetical protein
MYRHLKAGQGKIAQFPRDDVAKRKRKLLVAGIGENFQ